MPDRRIALKPGFSKPRRTLEVVVLGGSLVLAGLLGWVSIGELLLE
jgi:hypothetical protein